MGGSKMGIRELTQKEGHDLRKSLIKDHKQEKQKKINLIASKFAFIEDLLNELSNSELERLYNNALEGEYEL